MAWEPGWKPYPWQVAHSRWAISAGLAQAPRAIRLAIATVVMVCLALVGLLVRPMVVRSGAALPTPLRAARVPAQLS